MSRIHRFRFGGRKIAQWQQVTRTAVWSGTTQKGRGAPMFAATEVSHHVPHLPVVAICVLVAMAACGRTTTFWPTLRIDELLRGPSYRLLAVREFRGSKMNWISQTCPVCMGRCGEALPRIGDQREISCTECGRYRITGTAEISLQNEAVPARRALLRQAAAIAARSADVPLIALREH